MGRVFLPLMNDGENIKVGFRGDLVNDDIGQTHHGELACALDKPLTAQQREAAEHHCCLLNARNDIVGSSGVSFSNIGLYRGQIVQGLRCEANVQDRVFPIPWMLES